MVVDLNSSIVIIIVTKESEELFNYVLLEFYYRKNYFYQILWALQFYWEIFFLNYVITGKRSSYKI